MKRAEPAVPLSVRGARYNRICRYFKTFSYFRALGVFFVAHVDSREEGATPRLASRRRSTLLGETLRTPPPLQQLQPQQQDP
ncbi:hypothetical protein PBY51_017166 [Eleginops maclovinus]|uniref:Uncharacterized protein n=1 Tax=Eleginops maclovinus TaxID=56733 RepID=A0AAN7XGK1_ELEMC|nr:hypothetical protein PBY51_017166 [Eleginops maclovinus]